MLTQSFRTGKTHLSRRRRAALGVLTIASVAGSVLMAAAPAQATKGYPITDRFYVSDSVYGVGIDHQADRAFVANETENTVSMLDTKTGRILKNFAVGQSPTAVAVAPHLHLGFVTNSGSHELTILSDAHGRRSVRTVQVGNDPMSVAVDARLGRAYVSNVIDSTISVVKISTGKVIATVKQTYGSDQLAVSPVTHMIFLTNTRDNTLTEIDGTTLQTVATVDVGNDPSGVVANWSGTRAYVSNLGEPLQIVDTAAAGVVGQVDVPYSSGGPLALDGSQKRLYAATGDHVYAIDLHHRRIVGSTRFEHTMTGINVDPSTHRVYVTAGYHLSVITPRSYCGLDSR